MKFTNVATALQLLAAVVVPSQCSRLLDMRQTSGSPVEPEKDPFYQPTGDWQSKDPGTILAHRPVPFPIKDTQYQSAYQLLYRTTDSLGNATATITTVIIPQNANYSRLLSYQTFEDSSDPECAPSYTLQEGGFFQLDTGFKMGLAKGWIISTPDYEGPEGAFTAGVISGQATLDSIRAVLASSDITKVNSDAVVALYGYSGGALASEWALELQGTYAPELKIAGAAFGGTTPNVSSVALSINGKADAGLFPSGFLGLASAYPNITTRLNESFVSAEKREDFWSVKEQCLAETAVNYANVDFFSYFSIGKAILTQPESHYAINSGGQMGLHGTPLTSNLLYVYKSTKDEVSPVEDTDKLIDQYCKAGSTIHYIRDDFGSHTMEATVRANDALNFVQGLFNGTAQMQGCLIETFDQAGKVLSSSTVSATTSVTPTPTSSSGMSSSATPTSGSSGSGGSSSGGSSGNGGSSSGGSSGSGTGQTSAADQLATSLLAGGLAFFVGIVFSL